MQIWAKKAIADDKNASNALNASLQNNFNVLQNECKGLKAEIKALGEKNARFKQHLSYKLDFALINAYKTRWHSGLITFFLRDVWKIYRDFKKKLNEKKAGKMLD